MEGVAIAQNGALAVTTFGEQFMVVYQVEKGNDLGYVLGGYS